MANINSEINDLADRILSLSALFPTDKQFLKECGIPNHSLITDLKKGRIKNPGADILALIVRGTGCSGSWLLTGKGDIFEPNHSVLQDNGVGPAKVKVALQLIDEIERNADALHRIDLPDDVDLKLARLLVKILERRRGNAG